MIHEKWPSAEAHVQDKGTVEAVMQKAEDVA